MYASAHPEAAALVRRLDAAALCDGGWRFSRRSHRSTRRLRCLVRSFHARAVVVPAMAAEALPVYASARPEVATPWPASCGP